MARFGNTVVTHNNMTEEQHKEWISRLASHYIEEKEKIDTIIEKIKEGLFSVIAKDKINALEDGEQRQKHTE